MEIRQSAINSKIQCIRAFYSYMYEEKMVKENISKKVKLQKEDIKIDIFTDEKNYKMLAYYRSLRRKEQSYFSYRGYLLIVMLLGTGLRSREIRQLKWFDVDIVNYSMNVYGKEPPI